MTDAKKKTAAKVKKLQITIRAHGGEHGGESKTFTVYRVGLEVAEDAARQAMRNVSPRCFEK
jgi:hypothetical protein